MIRSCYNTIEYYILLTKNNNILHTVYLTVFHIVTTINIYSTILKLLDLHFKQADFQGEIFDLWPLCSLKCAPWAPSSVHVGMTPQAKAFKIWIQINNTKMWLFSSTASITYINTSINRPANCDTKSKQKEWSVNLSHISQFLTLDLDYSFKEQVVFCTVMWSAVKTRTLRSI